MSKRHSPEAKPYSRELDAKVLEIFRQRFGQPAESLSLGTDPTVQAAVQRAFPKLDEQKSHDLAFHLSDWRADGAFLLALMLIPDQFTPDEAAKGIKNFLVHAPNHIAAAAKLGGYPVEDIFKIGALDGE